MYSFGREFWLKCFAVLLVRCDLCVCDFGYFVVILFDSISLAAILHYWYVYVRLSHIIKIAYLFIYLFIYLLTYLLTNFQEQQKDVTKFTASIIRKSAVMLKPGTLYITGQETPRITA